MDDFKCQIEGYTKEQLDEMITILKKRLRDIKRSENNEKMADYKRYVRLTKNTPIHPILREIDLMWRKEQCGLITAEEREKILGELLSKLKVESDNVQRDIEVKLKNLEDILKLQGSSDTYIQHNKLCKLRSLGIITKYEERRRIENLYNPELAKIRTLLKETGVAEKDIEIACVLKMLDLEFITPEEANDRIECLKRATF